MIQDFENIHSNETCLIIGNGPGLGDIPIWFLESYPSLGSNLIYRLENFKPTYYAAIDRRVKLFYDEEAPEYYRDIPTFVPEPKLGKWKGDNVHHFRQSSRYLFPNPKAGRLFPRSFLTEEGITYSTVTHLLLQLAYFMGFTTMLCVGLDNTDDGKHFYGPDKARPNTLNWDKGYAILREGFIPRKIINISTRTKVKSLPRDDWRNYIVTEKHTKTA